MGIYVEDGNEMRNTISNNVATCTNHHECSLDRKAGIYVVGNTNDFIGNRLSG